MENAWVAFHIFYYGDMDALILESVRQITELQRQKAISEYFFVRYWNGGPHLRLRVRVLHDQDQTGAGLKSKIVSFLQAHPGGQAPAEAYAEASAEMIRAHGRLSSATLLVEERPEPQQPGDSIQIREYCFDSQRYGNTRPITEAHFCRSSEMAAFVIRETQGKPVARLSLVPYLLAAAIPAVRLETVEAIELFGAARDLLARMFQEFSQLPTDIRAKHRLTEEDHHEFRDLFFQLEHPLPIPGQHASVNKLLRFWEDELHSRYLQLQGSASNGQLLARPQHVIMDYLHMLNNRLGITLSEEFELYHLIASALEYLRDGKGTGRYF